MSACYGKARTTGRSPSPGATPTIVVNGSNLVPGSLGEHAIQLGNGKDIFIDGSVTLTQSADTLRQVWSDWKASGSTAVDRRLKVIHNAAHPSHMSAGSGRNRLFYTSPETTSNRKATDRLN